jgi:hypothetical protein
MLIYQQLGLKEIGGQGRVDSVDLKACSGSAEFDALQTLSKLRDEPENWRFDFGQAARHQGDIVDVQVLTLLCNTRGFQVITFIPTYFR